MIFDSLSAFIEMGGYGLYVWSAYGITLIVFVYNILRPIQMRKVLFTSQKRILQREQPQALDEGATS